MICLHLPFPVSVNAMYRSNRGRVHLSAKYMRWIGQAGMCFMEQKRAPGFGKPIAGHFNTVITLDENNRGPRDGDNHTKCVLDFCQKQRLIENDKWSDRTTVQWGAVDGCRVELFGMGEDRKGGVEALLDHLRICATGWDKTGISRLETIIRTANEIEELIRSAPTAEARAA